MNMSLSSTVHVIVAGELIIEPTVITVINAATTSRANERHITPAQFAGVRII